jgi:hypothetical protein
MGQDQVYAQAVISGPVEFLTWAKVIIGGRPIDVSPVQAAGTAFVRLVRARP